jgi:hypothetical protein
MSNCVINSTMEVALRRAGSLSLWSACGADTVNTASRLEALCKVYDCELVVSDDLVACAGAEFQDARPRKVEIRGRVYVAHHPHLQMRARAILGELAPRERDRMMSAFRRGDIDIVTSVDLFNEGIDVPDVDLIAFMRVTHSRRIFVQQLGRGLRVSPTKDRVVVLDFVSDLRRIAEVIKLDGAVRSDRAPVERLGLGNRIVNFRDASAGSFIMEWLRDQADLLLREGDPSLELPRFDFPEPVAPGGIQ